MRHAYDDPSRIAASFVIAIAGGATWLGIETVDQPNLGVDLVDMVRLTTVTAWIGGFLAMPFFGLPGRRDVAAAALGAILATIIGAAGAASVVGGVAGIALGPLWSSE